MAETKPSNSHQALQSLSGKQRRTVGGSLKESLTIRDAGRRTAALSALAQDVVRSNPERAMQLATSDLDENGEMSGGPMYYISKGLNMPWLGAIFAVFATVAAFGIGNMVQSNSVADAVEATFSIPTWATGVTLMVCTAAVILGGIKSIGKVTSVLVPIMIFFYVMGAGYIILTHITEVPAALVFIVKQSFNPTAAVGGFAGATIMLAIRMGVARGVFSNESGLGSVPIAAAAAQTKSPASQTLVSMTQTFIDTLVVCTMTGLVLIITGAWSNGQTGAELTTTAFQIGMPGGAYIVTIGIILFAYSTMLGWCYYGEKSIEFLFGVKSVLPYRIVFVCFVGVGAVAKLSLVWNISDTLNGLMALPNLIGLIMLTPVIVSETKKYFDPDVISDNKTNVDKSIGS